MLGWSAGSGCGSSLQKEQERRRADKASPVAAPMPKSVSFERKDRLLRERMCCVPFTDGVAWYL